MNAFYLQNINYGIGGGYNDYDNDFAANHKFLDENYGPSDKNYKLKIGGQYTAN